MGRYGPKKFSSWKWVVVPTTLMAVIFGFVGVLKYGSVGGGLPALMVALGVTFSNPVILGIVGFVALGSIITAKIIEKKRAGDIIHLAYPDNDNGPDSSGPATAIGEEERDAA